MLPTGIARAMRGLRRLPATTPRNPAATRTREPTAQMLERLAALHGRAVDGSDGGSDGVEDTSFSRGGNQSSMGALDLFLLLDPAVPVTVSVPRHQTTTADGFVISIEATCSAEFFCTVIAAEYAKELMTASAEEAALAEMAEGGWSYESICLSPINKQTFGERVLARMHGSSSAIVFKKYAITSLSLDPPATLALAATQEHEPDDALMGAVSVELARQIRTDNNGRTRTTQERVYEVSKAVKRFTSIYNAYRPQQRRWIRGLFIFVIIFVLVGSVALYGYNTLSTQRCAAKVDTTIEACAAKVDTAIEAGANSCKYHMTGGWFGETLVQRGKRLAAEAERQRREEQRKKQAELERLRREEERLKWIEERRRAAEKYDMWRRAQGLKPSPLGRLVIQLDIFHRYQPPGNS